MKYPSRYSNGKEVSAAQYITEIICEKKAKINKEDLHFRFWTNKKWSKFFRDQITTANKLINEFGEKSVIKALNSTKADRIYSLRAPHLKDMIREQQEILSNQNTELSQNFMRKEDIIYRKNIDNKKSILSRLEDIDHGN
jgi:ribosomal protein S25